MITLLDAVNEIRFAARLGPVNSLNAPIDRDTAAARRELANVSREVQMKGWEFNTDFKVTLQPNDANRIILPSNVLRVEFQERGVDYSQRGQYVYSVTGQTYDITASITADRLIRELPWDYLPEPARNYIMRRAARQFSAKVLPSEVATQEAGREEMQAWRELKRHHSLNTKPNFLNNPETAEATERRWP